MILYDYIASIPGPRFLGVYAIWIALVVVIVLLIKWFNSNSRSASPGLVPEQADPYKIAYLRNESAPIELAVVALLQKGLLQKSKTGRSVRRTKKKLSSGLHPMEIAVYREVGDRSPAAHKLLGSSILRNKVDSIFHHHHYEFDTEGYFTDSGNSLNSLRIGAVALVLGLGILKLIAAFSMGHYNVSFLVILMSLGVCIAYVSTFRPRLSGKGNQYLKSVQSAFGNLNTTEQNTGAMLLAVAVGSSGVLGGTSFADMALDFAAPGSSLGSMVQGCSGCSSCGGGCGGGCGGCGG